MPPLDMTEASTGKFCMLFAPVSASLGSFRLTTLGGYRSIPSPPFEVMEFDRNRFFVPLSTYTPIDPLKPIVFPTTELLLELPAKATPASPFVSPTAPTVLPWIKFPVAKLPKTYTPVPSFPEIKLPVPELAPPIVLLDESMIRTPIIPLGRVPVLAAFTPM